MYGTTIGTPATAGANNVDLEAQQSTNQNLIGNSNVNNNDDLNSEETPLTANVNENNGNYSGDDGQMPDGARLLDVMELARACRLIRLFAIIDCVLMILFAFWGDLLFLAGVPLAICGYFGAKNLKRGALVCSKYFVKTK